MFVLTAISGLSASTYSCGGDAGRFLFAVGGEAAAAPFLKYLSSLLGVGFEVISFSLTSEGAEDNEDMSDEDMVKSQG